MTKILNQVAARRVRTVGFAVAAVLLAAAFSASSMLVASAAPSTNTVLILDSTVSGGASSLEAQHAIALGFSVEVVTDAQWAAKTTADFATYRAIVLGDPTCGFPASPYLDAPAANAATWAAAVTGPVLVFGSDPVFHQGSGGSATTLGSIRFATSDPTRTGAYITTSCYYDSTAPGTPVPALSGFGTFTAVNSGSCSNNIAVVATHPSLGEYTAANLGPWFCSTHNAFDAWPLSFEVLGLALDAPVTYTAPGGEQGSPYILARGVTVISDITLAPATATNEIGDTHTLTATVTVDGSPVVGTLVTFTAIAGPHTGALGTATTDGLGVAMLGYVGTLLGTDTIEAGFFDGTVTQRSNRVEAEWIEASGPVETCVDLLRNQTVLVGSVCVSNDGTNLYVEYNVDPASGCELTGTHLAVSDTDVSTWKAKGWTNKKGNPEPGHFPYGGTVDPAAASATYTIPLADLTAASGDTLWIGAHAGVMCEDAGGVWSTSAWGAGPTISPKGNWGTYFTYVVA